MLQRWPEARHPWAPAWPMMMAMGDRLPVPRQAQGPPTVLRAATSFPSLGAAGAAGAITIVAGLPASVVVLLVVIFWATATGIVLPLRRRRRLSTPPPPDPPNPYAVPQPWRDLVSDVLRSQQKFGQVIADTRPGPLRERLSVLGERVDDGVRECWVIAQRGAALNAAVARLDPAEIHRKQVLIEAQLGSARRPGPTTAGEPGTAADNAGLRDALGALRAQTATVARLQAVADGTRGQLQRLAARLGEAVAEAVELSVTDPETTDVHALTTGIDAVVGELETLSRAVDEAEHATDHDTAGGQTGAGG